MGLTSQLNYTPLQRKTNVNFTRNELCRQYFLAGYNNAEILLLLEERHSLKLSNRHLRRLLNGMGLFRRQLPNLPEIVTAVQLELDGSGSTLGYRALQRRLLTNYGMVVPRNLVSETQRHLDPAGVEARLVHRLRRRVYINDGPNYLIHIDGFDKLKRYGFAVHGAVDGFSRRVLWLRVARSNNKPEIVATYFVEYLMEIEAAPRCIRIDAGTENTLIEDIQRAFRADHSDDLAASGSVIMGPSPANQRVERFWRTSREAGGQFWMDLFKDLESEGHVDPGDPQKIEVLRFAFMELIQQDLNKQLIDWNQHQIRQCNYTETLGGKPDMLYFAPELYNAVDYKSPVSLPDLEKVYAEFCQPPHPKGCEANFAHRCERLMEAQGKAMPRDYKEALDLYGWLVQLV